jgi:alpha-1,4-digalacturonate transport system permease protein
MITYWGSSSLPSIQQQVSLCFGPFSSPFHDLIESARIDGASDGMIFLKIMLPIARPIIMTLGIFSFQWRWNDYIWPLIVLNNPKKYTLQVANRSLVGAENIHWTILIAASVISVLPLLLVFLAFQRWTLDSNLDSGLK